MKKDLESVPETISGAIPLVVDLDGTLLQSDLTLEALLIYIKQNPWHLVPLFFWSLVGRAYVKAQLPQKISLDVTGLPYSHAVVELIQEERAKARPLILATGSHRTYAEQVATHLNLFDRVMGTEGTVNLTGVSKRKALVEAYGAGGFDYIGNSKADLPVWAAARHAIVVTPQWRIEQKARAQGNVLRVIRPELSTLLTLTKVLRLLLKHWRSA